MIALLIVLGLAIWASFVVILVVWFGMSAGTAAGSSIVIAALVILIEAWGGRRK